MPIPPTTQAMLVRQTGSWNDVRLETIPTPTPAPGEILIHAEAAALNFPDTLIVEGRYQHKPPTPFIPGRDVAGRVLAIGPGVHTIAPGDRVAAQPPHGCFATHVISPAIFAVPIPKSLPATSAAAANTVLATVVAAMSIRARLQPGEHVLITGAAGGVGSAAIQYARLIGAIPIALVSSAAKEHAARTLGAPIVLRTDHPPGTDPRYALRNALHAHLPEGADAIIDVVGGDLFPATLRCLRPGGRCIIVGFAAGSIPTIQLNTLLLRDLTLIGSSLNNLFLQQHPEFLTRFAQAFQSLAEGRITIPIDSIHPLHQAHAAIARLAGRHAIGKVVLHPME